MSGLLAKKIKKILKHPRKAQRFINLQLEMMHGFCPKCQEVVNKNKGLPDFKLLCEDCQAYAKQYEDELNELIA